MSCCGGQVVVPEGGTVGDVVWFESGTVLPEDQPPDASKGIYRCASKTGDGCEGGPEGKLTHHRAKANTRLQQQNTAKANREKCAELAADRVRRAVLPPGVCRCAPALAWSAPFPAVLMRSAGAVQRREGSTVCMGVVGGGTVAGGRAGPAARSRSAPATCSRCSNIGCNPSSRMVVDSLMVSWV